MFIKDYISKDFPCFSLTDSIESAREMLEDFGYSHIFIKKSHHFHGAIAKDFLYEAEGTLKELEHQIERFAIIEDNNIMDSIRLFYTFNSNVIPVILANPHDQLASAGPGARVLEVDFGADSGEK